MYALTTLTTLATLITATLAGPVVERLPNHPGLGRIVKRGEGVHLVNCVNYSAVVYCANDSDCNHFPGSGNQCIPDGGGITHWEGGDKRCTFPGTGTEFKWNIRSDAQSQANYVNVGTGNNGFHGFTIFKDDKHVMYKDGNGNACSSIYYALP
ncbi:hypothetical protein QBC47DRAFT_424474 [Echria macrotheca]|uniref:Uncharacterized protein n=1 Tax=Echria macrotheca TaxID=438768 RepID=A0AAJ0B8D8_9PEZI|nr:hypothetical protein QBC47DRAFT_424474 [Echria macrotheca]